MSYDLENINTLFAEIAECMHRNPARAMRLLGKAKEKVQQALERAASAAHKPDGGDAEDAARYRCFRAAMVNENEAWLESIEDAMVAMGCTPEIVPTAGQVDAAFDAAISAQQRQPEGDAHGR